MNFWKIWWVLAMNLGNVWGDAELKGKVQKNQTSINLTTSNNEQQFTPNLLSCVYMETGIISDKKCNFCVGFLNSSCELFLWDECGEISVLQISFDATRVKERDVPKTADLSFESAAFQKKVSDDNCSLKVPLSSGWWEKWIKSLWWFVWKTSTYKNI